jgi:uncharacterized protein
MSEGVAFKALEMGARLSSDSCGIVFFGGEPLLHKDLISATVARARQMEVKETGRFHFKVTTNGALLDERFLEFAIRNGVLVAMSFDGVREAHDRHRRFPDGSPSFDVLLERLKLLLAIRPYASVLMVVNPDTAQYLTESVSFLLDLSCRYIIVSLNYAAHWQSADFRTLWREYKRLGALYIKWTSEGRKFYLSPFEVKLSSHINRHCYRKERCELARRQISIDPQGYLYPCVQFTKAGPESKWRIGTVFDGIDEKARLRIHNESEKEKKVCQKCAIKDRCNNSCGCLNWQTTGSVNQVSTALCRHEQILTRIADRVGKVLYRDRDALFLHKHYNASYPVLSLLEDTLSQKSANQQTGFSVKSL